MANRRLALLCLGNRIVPGKTKRKDAVHLGRRRISVFRDGTRNRGEVEA
jgi:hypothetical protein